MRAVPRIHTDEMTPSTRKPDEAERAGLSETARMALPRRVRIRATQVTTKVMIEIAKIATSLSDSAIGP